MQWINKYSPKTITQCILPTDIKDTLQSFIETDMPSLLLSGSPGIGKTTVAKALCNDLDALTLFINASLDRNIDTLKNEITEFVSTGSISKQKKVVILDEADYLNPTSFQPALRGFIEQYSGSCKFILTANYPKKIIPALHSRCKHIDFSLTNDNKKELVTQFLQRFAKIFKANNIDYEKKVFIKYVVDNVPDFRNIIINLENNYRTDGKITSRLLTLSAQDIVYDNLLEIIHSNSVNDLAKWTGEHSKITIEDLSKYIWGKRDEVFKENNFGNVVIILAKYQYQNNFVVDEVVNKTAMLYELSRLE